MERYFTTVALVGVNDGNLPVHRYFNFIVMLKQIAEV